MNRRGFFGTLGAIAAVWVPFSHARLVLITGGIGRIAFCRVSTENWLHLAREMCPAEICSEAPLIAEVDPAGVPAPSGAVFLGSKATLVVGHKEWRMLP